MNPSRPQLRDHFKQQRRAIAADIRAGANASICAHLSRYIESLDLDLDMDGKGVMVAAFMATAEEVDLHQWRAAYLLQGGRIALPRINPGRTMTFHEYTADTTLEPHRYGILEPESSSGVVAAEALQVVLVPLVAFDRNGARLGMGGGYYDRYLVGLANTAITVGVAFACQRSDEPLPTESWDMPMQAVVTENGVLEFG